MNIASSRSRRSLASFTLVEVLTAIVILGLLVVVIFQIISLASLSTNQASKKNDAFDQARTALDRFGIDWDARARRTDLPPVFTNAAASAGYSDTALFYSQVDGFGTGTLRPMSQVAYYVTNSPAYSLNRWANGDTWTNNASGTPTQIQFYSVFPAIFPPNNNYQILANDIYRLQFCFLLKSTGQLVATPPANSSNIGAVVVSLAVLDKFTRKQVSAAQIQTLVSYLTDATDPLNGTNAADQWNTNLNADRASATPVNAPLILQNVRIYQRIFYSN